MPSYYFISVLARIALAISLTLLGAISYAETPARESAPSCEANLVTNINAAIAMADYNQTNRRPYVAYTHKLGPHFLNKFANLTKPVRWLDSGAGYGLASLEMARSNPFIFTTVINAQDAWPYIFSLNKQDSHCERITLTRMGLLMGVRMDDIVDPSMRCFSEGWFGRLIPRLEAGFAEIVASGRFDYIVGMAEDVLPGLTQKFHVLTDLFGGYFYSAARLQLLEDYYQKLTADGEAFVVIFTEDRQHQVTPPKIDAYGPRNMVEGTHKSFEEVLCELYPDVFQILETDHADSLTRFLHIRKVTGFELRLSEIFEVVKSWYDHDAPLKVSRQIPNILVRRRL